MSGVRVTWRDSRWGRLAAGLYLVVALAAGFVAIQRLLVSSELPGLAAWEFLVLGLPWTMILGTPMGRQVGGVLLATVAAGSVVVNAAVLYFLAAGLERWRRATYK